MAYIGHDIQYGTISKQAFTANGSTTVFTLDEGVGASSNLLVAVGGVIQEPDEAYTAIGTVLTFSTAPANGATVWAIKLGNETGSAGTLRTEKVTHQTGVGNGTTTPFALNKVAPTSSSIIVALDGLIQKPEIEFTVDGTVLTLSSSPSSSVKIIVYFLTTPNTLTSVEAGSVTAAKLNSTGTWPAWNGSNLTNLTAANLTGTLPAIDGSALTGMNGGFDTKTGSDPLITSNKELGHLWLNKTTGELFCCTDATTNNNVWKNVGEGSGNISNVAPTNPNNTASFVTPFTESTTYNFTFSGATDPDAGDSVTHYMVDQISNAALTVTAAEVAAGQPHAFTTAAVGSDTNVTFRVRAKDNHGAYSSGVTVSIVVENDTIPTNATNASGFADMNQSSSYNYTFAGGTDDKAGFSYVVDQISNAALTVSSAEVAGGSAHTFNSGAVGSDTAITFRVRTKDSAGQYSSGVTVSMTVLAVVYTTATGGSITTSGDYKIHTFTGNSSFNVSQIGNLDATVDWLVIAGGGAGGHGTSAGGGGAGGYRTGTGHTVSVQNYSITIGAGGSYSTSGTVAPSGNNSSALGYTSTAGGGGGRDAHAGGSGGSGGGGGGHNGAGGQGTSGQGYAGGYGHRGGGGQAGGGGGASEVGDEALSVPHNQNCWGGQGGDGLASSITGSSVVRAGGGTGGACRPNPGGAGGGGYNANATWGGETGRHAAAGTPNTGGGGGGGTWDGWNGNNGGSGVVVIRYKYQN